MCTKTYKIITCTNCNGNSTTPVCMVCHGRHVIAVPDEPIVAIDPKYWQKRCEAAEKVIEQYTWNVETPWRVSKAAGYDEAVAA